MYYVDMARSFHEKTEQGYTVIKGIKYNLPRYFKNQIFPDYKIRKIGKKNYANYMENQNRVAARFPTMFHFEKNQFDLRKGRYVDIKTCNNSKI